MLFNSLYLAYFNADAGAYSIVTGDERRKGQITITETDGEASVLVKHFSEEQIPRGGARASRLVAMTHSRNGEPHQEANLAINFPKQNKNELRVYRNSSAGFNYEAGDVWFIYTKEEEIHIGSMPEQEWRRLGTTDDEDSQLQRAILTGDNTPIRTALRGVEYLRNPALARKALQLADYRCEYDPATQLFLSRSTGLAYLEAHHLIPLFASQQFGSQSLDTQDNIVALAPHWHRAIHHAEHKVATAILAKLIDSRKTLLDRFNLSLSDLVTIYGCAEIC